jgi:isoleucyl-tRNA synthetase
LFTAIRAVTLVLAPLVPFITEEIWQNAIRPFSQGAAESVHLEFWPTENVRWRDDKLLERTTVVRAVIRSALRLRKDAKMRVRQPLRALYVVGGDAVRQAIEEQLEVVASELNVKEIVFLDDVLALEEEVPALDFRRAGPVLRTELGAVAVRVKEIDEDERAVVTAAVRQGKPVRLAGQDVDLPPEIFVFERRPRAGFILNEQRAGEAVVAFDARLDEDLLAEGTARDLIRHIQVFRRDAGLEVSRRIALGLVATDPEVQRAIDQFRDMIAREVLADTVLRASVEEPTAETKLRLRGKDVAITLSPTP